MIMKDNDGFKKAMITKDFEYFMNTEDGSHHLKVKMYDIETGELAFDNDIAIRDMFENLHFYHYEWISERLEFAREFMLERDKIKMARDYFLKFNFKGKITSLIKDGAKGAFNEQLKLNLGFELTDEELRQTQILIKETTYKNQLHM